MTISRVFPVFSVAFAVLYLAAVEYNLALFTYHAQIGQWGWLAQPVRSGPAMYWYGWLATAALGSTIVAALALAVPRDMLERVPGWLVWLVPLIAMAAFAIILRGFFLR